MLNRTVVDTVSKTFTAEVVFTVKVNRKLSLILIPELQLRYKSHFYSAVDWQTQKLKGQLRSSLTSVFYFCPESSVHAAAIKSFVYARLASCINKAF